MSTRPLTEADLDERAHLLASWPANQPSWTDGEYAVRGEVSLEEIRWADSREEAERESLPLIWLIVLWVVFLALVCAAYMVWGEAAQVAAIYVLPGCCGGCGQGRGPCDCSRPALAIERMFAEGVIEGPYRKTRPYRMTWSQRIRRWWAENVIGGTEWGDDFKG